MNPAPIRLSRLWYVIALLLGPPPLWGPPPPPEPITVIESDPHDALSPAAEQALWAEIQHNVTQLRNAGLLAAPDPTQAVTFDFPLRLAPGLPDDAGFRVSAFADHNANSSAVLDYNGGARTYDGHRGTDYALYPFSWNKLEAGEVQVIAAAAGTIAYKANVDATDHNCNVSSSDPWNYVGVVHADGRLTLYGHLRYNSLTSKGVGQTVAAGEYLGTAASSGNSSGPHLHFEVRYGSYTNNEWLDPYAGPYSQPETLWVSQRPYYDSAINRLATHAAPPSTPDPCLPTLTNLQDSFTTPRNIYFYAYYRDYQGVLPTALKIYRPDGSVFQAWSYTDSTSFASGISRAWVYAFGASEPAGTWRFEATYNGQVSETFFNVNAPPAITVSSPNGGEQWDRQLPHTITWADNLGGAVNLALYRNGVYSTTIASNTPSDGQYLWTPGVAQAPGTDYTIRVISVISPTVYDASNAPFSILPLPPPNLSLAPAPSTLNPQPGQALNYLLTLTNSGAGPATNARLATTLPSGLTLAGPITLNPPSAGTIGTLPNAITGLTLNAGQSATVAIPVVVNWGQAAGTLITHTATLTSAEIITPLTTTSVITVADAPLVARDDGALTAINTALTLYPLSNDGDPNGDPLTLTALGNPSTGTVSALNASLVYTPALNFLGPVAFTYTVSTSAEAANATVTVWVVAEVFKVYLPLVRR